jgi:hypothetical protein
MADGDFKTQVSRDENANSASNVMFFQIADDAGNVATITGGKLDVNATVTLETAYVDDSAFVIGTDKVNAQGFLADETTPDSVDEGDIGLARMTLTRIQLATIDDGAGNRLGIQSDGDITSRISDGTDDLEINADGSINVVVAGQSGTSVHDYDTAVAVANAAVSNHDYTVETAEVFTFKQFIVGGSGKIRADVSTGPVAGLVPLMTVFVDKDKFADVTLAIPVAVTDASTGTVRIARENRSGAQDVFSTIIGTTE